MKNHIAIVKVSGTNELENFQDFNTQAEAESHVQTYGGFVVQNPGVNSIVPAAHGAQGRFFRYAD
jgi:hypothetical protein